MDFEFSPQQAQLREATFSHGGLGSTRKNHVERYRRAALVPRIAPVGPHPMPSNIAEQVPGLPQSHRC